MLTRQLDLKRIFDVAVAATLLLVSSPLFVAICLAALSTGLRPVLYHARRVGLHGLIFTLFKFRTMKGPDGQGLACTGITDRRITRLGHMLRRSKLNELPQLMNVLRGDMSIVGPRPESPVFATHFTPAEREHLLSVRPGLVDPATVFFRDEEVLLASVPESDRERFYVQELLHRKSAISLAYLDRMSIWRDLLVIMLAIVAMLTPGHWGASLAALD